MASTETLLRKVLAPLLLPPLRGVARSSAKAFGRGTSRKPMNHSPRQPSDVMRWIEYPTNRSPGDWVTWKVHPACLELSSTGRGSAQYGDFVLAAERAALHGLPFGVELERRHCAGDHAIRVVGRIGPPQKPRHMVDLGFLPPRIAAQLANVAVDVPLSAELKRAGLGDRQATIMILGLMPSQKSRT